MSGRLSEGGGAENARYANRETALMFPIVSLLKQICCVHNSSVVSSICDQPGIQALAAEARLHV